MPVRRVSRAIAHAVCGVVQGVLPSSTARAQSSLLESLERRQLFAFAPEGYTQVGSDITFNLPTSDTASPVSGPVLDSGTEYIVVASGTGAIGSNANGTYYMDAEFADLQDGNGFRDSYPGADWGIRIAADTSGTEDKPGWENVGDHEYKASVTGEGVAIQFSFDDDNYPDNTGFITLQVYQPATYEDEDDEVVEEGGCKGDEDQIGSDSNSKNGNAGERNTDDPIRYSNGVVYFEANDLDTGAFGLNWGHTRTWTNDAKGAVNNINGTGWVVSESPRLKKVNADTFQVISGTNVHFFDNVGGTWTARHQSLNTLAFDSGTNSATLKDSTGKAFTFKWFASPSGTDLLTQGKLYQVTDAGGQATVLAFDSEGLVSTATRTFGSGSTAVIEQLVYTYGTGAADDNKLVGIQHRHSENNGSSWTNVRHVKYEYYTASEGSAGKLKKVEIRDGGSASAVIDTQYFRYWQPTGVTSMTASGSTVTVTTGKVVQVSGTWTVQAVPHDLAVGDSIVLSGATNAAYNGTFTVASVIDGNRFTVTNTSGSLGTSTTGAMTVIKEGGYVGNLKYALSADSYARAKAALGTVETALDSAVAKYADNYMEYDSSNRATKHLIQGFGCSTCGGAAGRGTYDYVYTTNANGTGYNEWRTKTVETLPDGNQNIVYSNQYGQVVLKSFKQGSQEWITYYQYDSQGRQILTAHPSAVTGYNESSDDLMAFSGGVSSYLKDSDGLIEVRSYYASTTGSLPDGSSSGHVGGGVKGYLHEIKYKKGETDASPDTQITKTYFQRTAGSQTIYPVATEVRYRNDNGGGSQTTKYNYTWQSGSVRKATRTVTRSAVYDGSTMGTVDQNGSNTTVSETSYFDTYGRTVWVVDAEGYITYNAYDQKTGALIQQITDANPGSVTSPPVTGPTRSGSLPTALHLITNLEVDELGRTVRVTDPNGNSVVKVYNDTYVQDGVTITDEVRTYRAYLDDNGTTGTTADDFWVNVGPIEITRTIRGATYSYDADRDGTVETEETNVGVSYAERVTSSASVTFDSNGFPTGTETLSAANVQSLRRDILSSAGQRIRSLVYTSLSGVTYAITSPAIGATGTNYLMSEYGYDDRGRANFVKTSDGTITRTVYDGLGRATSMWKGTNDAGATYSDPSGGGAGGNNMKKVSENVYDNAGVGDSNLTESKQFADASTSYSTKYQYDFRNRMTGMRGADKVATKYTLDNLGQQTTVETYADADSDFVIDSGELRGKTVQAFDERGQLYSTTTHEVDNSTGSTPGTVRDGFTNEFWYDARGNLIKTVDPSGRIDKAFFDGAGRVYRATISADPTEVSSGTYSNADDLSSDQVIEQYDYWLDAGGRTRISTTWMRDGTESSSITGLATATHFDHNAIAYFYDAANRLVATADYGRDGAEANGSSHTDVWNASGYSYKDSDSDGIPNVIDGDQDAGPGLDNFSTPQDTSYDWIYTTFDYDDAGRQAIVTDNADRETHTLYDLAGRVTKVIENYVDGTASDTETDSDRTTEYAYDTYGRLSEQIAYNPKGSGLGVEEQTTVYVYASNIDRSWVSSTIYPDSSDAPNSALSITSLTQSSGTATATVTAHGYSAGDVVAIEGANQGLYLGMFVVATVPDANHFTFTIDASAPASATGTLTATKVSGKDMVSTTYDRLGRTIATIDQRGVVHTFSYDSAGRLSADTATNLTAAIDNRVQRIGYAYDDLSRSENITSYADTSGTTVVNDVQYEYDGWGNVTKTYQAHDGAVSTGSTPYIEYIYEDGGNDTSSGVASYVRLDQVNYPANDGNHKGSFSPYYEPTYDIGKVLNRIRQMRTTGGLQLIEYKWVGAATLVNQILHPQISGGLYFSAGTKSSDYAGFDRYYRMTYTSWRNTSATKEFDKRTYTYDRMGNRLSMDNNSHGGGASDWDETYAYDDLNRLTDFQLGTISGSSINTPRFEQSWTLDSLGNWTRLEQTNSTSGTKALDTTAFPTYDRSRTNNAANEISSIVATSTSMPADEQPVYDAAGSMIQGPRTDDNSIALTLKYDAWNRQAGIDGNDDGDLVDDGDWLYEYDGIGRRISKWQDTADDGNNSAGSGEEYYYNEDYQMVEMRVATTASGSKSINANPKERILWDMTYIDSPAMIELDNNVNGTRDYRLWATWDANKNVTALLTDDGVSVERYAYTPYGQQIVINGESNYNNNNSDPDGSEWTVDTNGSDFGFVASGFQGLRFDAESGNWYQRARYSSPVLQFTQRDPLGTKYQDGFNIYNFESGRPVTYLDPSGLANSGGNDFDPYKGGGSGSLRPPIGMGPRVGGGSYGGGSSSSIGSGGTYNPGSSSPTSTGTGMGGSSVRIGSGGTYNPGSSSPTSTGTGISSGGSAIRGGTGYNPTLTDYYPPQSGFQPPLYNETLKPGTLLDRYGSLEGKYVSPANTPLPERALPPGSAGSRAYYQFKVCKPLDVESGFVRPWFGQPGEGIQYKLPDQLQRLVDLGFLQILKGL